MQHHALFRISYKPTIPEFYMFGAMDMSYVRGLILLVTNKSVMLSVSCFFERQQAP